MSEGIPVIKIKNIFDGFVSLDCDSYWEEIRLTGLERFLLQQGDILIAMTGATIGKVGIFNTNERALLNQRVGKIIPEKAKILPRYLFYVCRTDDFQEQVNKYSLGGAQPNISGGALEDLQIPLPPLPIQAQIVEMMDRAIDTKKRLESEADTMLTGVDDWLLGELGIEKGEKSQKKVFTVNINDLDKDSRIDPFHYTKEGKFSSNKYLIDILGNVAKVEKGQALSSSDLVEGNIPVIAGGQSSPYNHNISNYSGNIITVSASGAYSGFVWYHENPIFASDCSVIFSNNEAVLSTKFITYYLKSRQRYIYSLQKGAGQPHVYPNDLKEIQIPLPPLSEQVRIAEYISSIIETARVKREEAKRVYEEARREVELRILG